MSISDQLRAAIDKAESLSAIEEATGVDHSILRRFVSGQRDIRLATAERLLDYFGLVCTGRPNHHTLGIVIQQREEVVRNQTAEYDGEIPLEMLQ